MSINISETEPIAPHWARIDGAVRYSSIGRSTILQAVYSGAIRSIKFGEVGQKKTIRLIDLRSLDEFIENGGKRPVAAKNGKPQGGGGHSLGTL